MQLIFVFTLTKIFSEPEVYVWYMIVFAWSSRAQGSVSVIYCSLMFESQWLSSAFSRGWGSPLILFIWVTAWDWSTDAVSFFWLILSLSATYRKDGNLLFPDSFQFPKLQTRIKSCLIHRRFKHWWIFNYSARRQRLVAIVPEGQTLKAGTIHDEHTTVEACTVKITGRTFHWILMLVEKV